jgi:hypothetical protein
MRKTTLVILACGSALAFATPASAQAPCPGGRALNGACVDAGFSRGVTEWVTVFTQPKLSYTSPPYLPRDERKYPIPRDHHEISNLFAYPPTNRATDRRP